MRTLTTCTGLVFFLLAAMQLNELAAAEKIGVVNVERVIKEYEAARQAEARLEERAKTFAEENEEMRMHYEQLKREFERLRDESLDAVLTDAARDQRRREAEKKLDEIAGYEQKIREKVSLRRGQLSDQRRRVFHSLIETIRGAITRHAEREGFTLVLDGSTASEGVSAVLYHRPRHDITDAVIELLNAAFGDVRQGEATEEAVP